MKRPSEYMLMTDGVTRHDYEREMNKYIDYLEAQTKQLNLPVVRQSAYAVYPDSVGFDLANENTLMAVFRNEEQANKFGKMMWGAMYYIEKVDTEHFA